MVGVAVRVEPVKGEKVFFVDHTGRITRNYTRIDYVWGYDDHNETWCIDDPYGNTMEIYRSEGVWKQKPEGESYL